MYCFKRKGLLCDITAPLYIYSQVPLLFLESKTYPEAEVVQFVYIVSQHIGFVGSIAVINSDVQARAICPRVNVQTEFR